MRVGGLVLSAGLVFWAGVASADDDDPVDRESEFELSPTEAWAQEGFRIQLRLGKDSATSLTDRVSGASGLALDVEPGVRLSRLISLSANLHYGVFTGPTFSSAMRWTTTADVTLHPWFGFFVAAGFGYGGISGTYSEDLGGAFAEDGFGGAYFRAECDGLVGLARTGWLFPLGEIFSTGPVAQIDWQYSFCDAQDESGNLPPLEWLHRTTHFAWSLAWR